MTDSRYAFVYDETLSERKYERDLMALSAKLTTLNITGRDVRLAMFRSVKETIEGMVKQGVTTFVVVGNDRTLDKVMWFLPDLDVTLGYIPLLPPSEVAGPLAIPTGVAACDVLAARFVETIDVGMCDGRYFLSEAKMTNTVAEIQIDGKFSLSLIDRGTIIVRNLDIRNKEQEIRNDAKDGLLEVIVKPNPEKVSRWQKPKVEITKMYMKTGMVNSAEPVDVLIDGHMMSGFRFPFGIAPKKLKMIVGRGRKLSPQDGILSERTPSATLRSAPGFSQAPTRKEEE